MTTDYTDEEKAAMRERIKETVALVKGLFPSLAEAGDEELSELRVRFTEMIRECEREGDAELLSMIAVWFVLGAPKSTLMALVMFMEDSD